MVPRGRGVFGESVLRYEFRRAQEVVISCGIQFQVSHPAVVHKNVIEIPQIDVWQIVGQDVLHLGIERLAYAWVDGASRLINQRIQLWVGVKPAIGSVRRKFRRVEDRKSTRL